MMSHFSRFLGNRGGAIVASRFGKSALRRLHDLQEVTPNVALWLTDAVILDRIVGTVWPAALILTGMIGVDLLGNALGSPETTRILIGLLVLAALIWAVLGLVRGSGHLAPHLRFWLVTRLGPRHHLRLVLYNTFLEYISEITDENKLGTALHAMIKQFIDKIELSVDQFCFEIAFKFSNRIFYHILQRLFLAAIPLILALAYYRLILYPHFVRSFSGGLSPWRVAAYPIAALLDLLFASHFRLALAGQA